MIVCNFCGKSASQSFTLSYNGGITRTIYYCKDHNTNSKPPKRISVDEMKEIDPEFRQRFE